MKIDQVILDMKMYTILVQVELSIINILIQVMVFLEETKVIKALVTGKEHLLIRNNNRILQEEKMERTQMLFCQKEQKKSYEKEQLIRNKKIHTTLPFSMRKMMIIMKIKRKLIEKHNSKVQYSNLHQLDLVL
jgi:HD-GYP domain-containing protein (c-di-GMP phosphodiesterase class II)